MNLIAAILPLTILSSTHQTSGPVKSLNLPPLPDKRAKWWTDAKFGMFIHWGVYAIPATGEWTMQNNHVSPEQYRKLGDQFAPKEYRPTDWVKLARKAGMNYMVLTARHHDGYSLWNSPASIDGFNSFSMAAHRDLVADYIRACRTNGMHVGLYYSLMDWREPGYYKPLDLPDSAALLKAQCYGQVRELTHNYGPIDILWYDGGWLNMQGSDADAAWLWEPVKLNQMVRKANPNTLINPRSGWEGDFDCEEGGAEITGPIRPRIWEKCLNLNQVTWGFNRAQNLMSLNSIISMLVNAATRDGNLLLNVGPDAEGVIPPTHADRLLEVGAWLKKYGESIYGTRGGPLQPVDREYGTTYKGRTIYLHCWNASNGSTVGLPPIDPKILKATVLTGGKVGIQQTPYAITLRLSQLPTQAFNDIIIRLDCDRNVSR